MNKYINIKYQQVYSSRVSASKRMVGWSSISVLNPDFFSLPDLFLPFPLVCGNSVTSVSLISFRMTNTFPSFPFPATGMSADLSSTATVLPCPISPYSHMEMVCVTKGWNKGLPEWWREENALGAIPLSKRKTADFMDIIHPSLSQFCRIRQKFKPHETQEQ